MKLRIRLIIINIAILLSLFGANATLAVAPTCAPLSATPSFAEIIRRVACKAGYIQSGDTRTYTEADIVTIIGTFISIALGIAGIVFVVIVLYGGWLWGTARGNEEQVQQAEKLIHNAVLGIIIVLAVFTIARFVIDSMKLVFTQRAPYSY